MIGQIKQQIHELVQKYEQSRDYYRTSKFNETQVRNEFLDPLFEILGWDIRNKSGKSTNEREVLLEEALKANAVTHSKKPDYTFRLYGERKFFLEAKKPCVHINEDNEPAKQVRRYGFTAGLKISVLSNFEDLFIYDTTNPVEDSDALTKARIKAYHYTDYEDSAEELFRLLGRESVYNGQFEEEWKDVTIKVEHTTIDKLFLKQINEWRLMLGNEILKVSPEIDVVELGNIVQSYINKILFLRVCEDRNIEEYKRLLDIANNDSYRKLIDKFHEADLRYNSGLFQSKLSEDVICNISSSFWIIIRQLYYPQSPYSFSVLSSEILGRIYEIFLSKKLNITENGTLELIDKPENVDKDIVTTPNFIIREILHQTIEERITKMSDIEIFNLKCADIACGSGAFLLELYQLINDTLVDFYSIHDKTKLIQTDINTYKLKFNIKKRILTDCIFGVDKDYNAVEACKFGLLLKLLENETELTLPDGGSILPSLEDNISYGNSLFSGENLSDSEFIAINPHDFNRKFDYIVGNPPYLKTEDIKNQTPVEHELYPKFYKSASGQYDKSYLFVERALRLLTSNGEAGFIIPNKFLKVNAGAGLRKLLAEKKCLKSLMTFGSSQVFQGKSTYTCILALQNKELGKFTYSLITSLDKWKLRDSNAIEVHTGENNSLDEGPWVLPVGQSRKILESKIYSVSIPLGLLVGDKENIFNGIQTSKNSVYIHKVHHEDESYFYFMESDGNLYKVEKEVTRPYYKTSSKDALVSLKTFKPNSIVLYPYKVKNGVPHLIPISILSQKYPYLYSYLVKYKADLEKRIMDVVAEPKDKWYRFGRNQNLDKCEAKEKLIVGVLTQHGKYAIDKSRTFVTSGSTAGYCLLTIPDGVCYSLYYIQAILCSIQGEWLAAFYGEYYQNGYIARGTKILQQIPIRTIDFDNETEVSIHDDIVRCQKELIKLGDKLATPNISSQEYAKIAKLMGKKKNEQQTRINTLYDMNDDDVSTLITLTKRLYAAD